MNTGIMLSDKRASKDATRLRLLASAKKLLAEGGRDALTTRMVAQEVGVPQPTLYRLIGDKSVLIQTLIEHELSQYVASKMQRSPDPDPIATLRQSWDIHVQFGLDNPTIFILMWGSIQPGQQSEANRKGLGYLAGLLRDIAHTGRLTVPENTAIDMVSAACVGVTLKLLTKPAQERDLSLSLQMREVVIAAITTETASPQDTTLATAAMTVKAKLPDEDSLAPSVLTRGERYLLSELLDKLI